MRTAQTFRIVGVLSALSLAALPGCFEPASKPCGSGNFCPPGYRCLSQSAYERTGTICLPESQTCGDGEVESKSEQCDDGADTASCNGPLALAKACAFSRCGDGYINAAAGEKCDPADAEHPDRTESTECNGDCTPAKCGDGKLNKALKGDGAPLEECDDGADGSANCTLFCKVSKCGDGVTNTKAGEDCDPGAPTEACTDKCKTSTCGDGFVNTAAGEECDPGAPDTDTATCTRLCKTSRCGDEYVNKAAGEDCDDGVETTACTETCKSSSCGDGHINKVAQEECDHGLKGGETAACTAGCKNSTCGDNYINKAANEQCDDGTETANCTATCKISTCGDFYVNKVVVGGAPLEQCDDGPSGSATCTIFCTTSVCGDGKVNSLAGELCDPATVGGETATCNSDCTPAECGDNKLNRAKGEQCDDGATGSAGCTVKCTVSSCGDNIVNSLAVPVEDCDPGAPGAQTNLCNSDCTTATCGDGKVNAAHLVSAGGATHPEECDPGLAGETPNCNSDCTFARCGDGKKNTHTSPPEQCDPGAAGETTDCNADCTAATCGDGKINKARGEECDESGETAVCNGAAAGAVACHFSKCHDGYTNGLALENCDPGGTATTENATCNSDCTTSRCHDGKRNAVAGEDCDPGGTNTTETPDCNSNCTTSRCGDHVLNKAAGEQCDADVNCNNCKSADCGDDIVNPAIGEECDPGAAGETPSCTSNCKISSCGDAYPNGALVKLATTCSATDLCDTGDTCQGGYCYRPAETCDIGKPGQEDATCNSDCTTASCGDGKLNRANGELCDDKLCEDHLKACQGDSDCRTIGTGKCLSGSPTCNPTSANALACKTSYCGDSYTNALAAEQCDPGPSFETDACNSDCTLASCGDGKVNRKHALGGGGFEECDPGGFVSVDGGGKYQTADCNSDCTAARCGDNKVNHDAGEQCDDGPLGSATCTTDCRTSSCGDGKVNPKAGEECDEGTAVASAACNNNAAGAITAGVQCKATRCGDGFRNTAKEACDPGAGLIESAACNSDCTGAACGDGKLNVAAGEQCDAGAAGSALCNGNDSLAIAAGVQCKFARCGDAYTNTKTSPAEQCDPGASGETAGCNRDCSTASCGDGRVNLAAGEQCDDGLNGSATCTKKGATNAFTGASVECKLSKCGDGHTNALASPVEQCDPGASGETAGCNRDCSTASCGDSKVNLAAGEQCDDGVNGSATCTKKGATNAFTGASVECKLSKCGDGYTNALASPVEQCDPGASGETAGCNRDCSTASCGDSKVNLAAGEQCDDGVNGSATCTKKGATNAFTGASVECRLSKCGDGYTNALASPVEQCDPGASAETAGCNRDCTTASCGDSKINVARGEQCDVGAAGSASCNKAGAVNGGGTSVECKFSSCGDNYTNSLAGETCDLGSANNGNSKDCLANCILATCGDGYIETAGTAPHEICDQGADNDRTTCPYGSVSCTSCRSSCTQLVTINGAYCGDGTKQTGEQCDSGNTLGCGLCNSDCSLVLTEAPARGIVDFPDRSSLDDNMLLTLDDGLNGPVVFQFVQNSSTAVAAPRVKVDISGTSGDKDTEIAGKLVAAMATVYDRLRLKATTGSAGVVNLENAHVGKFGNRPMSCTDGSVYLYNNVDYDDALKQGVGYGCSEGVGCFDSRDCFPGTACVSHICTDTTYTLSVVTGTYLGRIKADVGALDCGTVCSDDYPANTLVVLTASATSPATWGGWEAAGPCGSAGMATTCTVTMDAAKTVTGIFNGVNQYQLTVTRTGLSGSISTGDGKITACTGTCTAGGYAASTSVTITATDGATDLFTSWAGACTGTTNPCVLDMGTADKGVTANFLPAFGITVTKSGTGTGAVADGGKVNCGSACSASYLSGTTITLTATADTTAIFKGWTGACTGTGTCVVTLDDAKTVDAEFEATTLTVTKAGTGTGAVASGGSEIDCGATCSHTFTRNAVVSLTATAASGSRFDPATGWTGDTTCTANPCSVTMSSAKAVTATFVKTYVVTVTYAGAGSGSVSGLPAACTSPGPCTGTFDTGSHVTLTATANAGSTFVKWTGVAGCNTAAACDINPLTADTTATAEFSSP